MFRPQIISTVDLKLTMYFFAFYLKIKVMIILINFFSMIHRKRPIYMHICKGSSS